ncbi:MAG: hypothetical protein O8C66_12135 [Candidatus Methanoperedens sp.]|nr:hypothetical protein [Candidatus Methanoperedens sp.]MCZ7371250.1 hypothetical protein [Candidatus Methanoperedens sp.]
MSEMFKKMGLFGIALTKKKDREFAPEMIKKIQERKTGQRT